MQDSTAKEIDKVIRVEGIVDAGVTRAMLNHTDPLTPRHIYSAIRVQRALVQRQRNEKFRAMLALGRKQSRKDGSTRTIATSPTKHREQEGSVRARVDFAGAF